MANNPRLIVIANEVKQSQKELTLPNGEIASGFALRNDALKRRRGSAAARFARRTLRIPHATPPLPSLLKKRGAIRIIFLLWFPLSNSLREGKVKGVSKKSPSLIQLERGK
jgi:hypothetical protein